MSANEKILQIVEKVFNKSASPEELEELAAALKSGENTLVLDAIENRYQQLSGTEQVYIPGRNKWEAMAESILQSDTVVAEVPVAGTATRVYRMRWFKYVTAACLAALIATLLYTGSKPLPERATAGQKQVEPSPVVAEVLPGSNKAVLQLSDGRLIALDSTKTGTIAQQGTAAIMKDASGAIIYHPLPGKNSALLYNTMRTPRGGQYQLILPDGTRVWLNAASSIRYPVQFGDKERLVETSGEVYFEVAGDPHKPFMVNAASGLQIQVLGTRFNVNTYAEEKWIRTTLLEGSVKVMAGNSSRLLVPGQQARTDAQGKLSVEEKVDLDAVVAWQKGLFNFNKSGIREVMNQLARWYDIDIQYQGKIPDQVYGGEMQRDLHLSQVLKILEKSGVHFKLQQKTLTVMP